MSDTIPQLEKVEVENVSEHAVGDSLHGGTIIYLDIGGKSEPNTALVCHSRSEGNCAICPRNISMGCGAAFGKERL